MRVLLNITAIQQNTHRIADEACGLLFRQLRREPIPQRRILVPPSILSGQTV